MTPQEAKRAAAAIELADALLEEFNNPSSALKGIGRTTMEKLLVYLKICEKAQRRRAKRSKEGTEGEADPTAHQPEADAESIDATATQLHGDGDDAE
jgi:DNA polymerase/3'-5' exonuclease PolX